MLPANLVDPMGKAQFSTKTDADAFRVKMQNIGYRTTMACRDGCWIVSFTR